MKTVSLCLLGVVFAQTAEANSYLDMITTPPEGYVETEPEVSAAEHSPLWYDGRVQTVSPVVTSPLPKYLAWQRAKAFEDSCAYVRDDVQNAIYFLSGAAVARLAYDIWGPYHRHHLLD